MTSIIQISLDSENRCRRFADDELVQLTGGTVWQNPRKITQTNLDAYEEGSNTGIVIRADDTVEFYAGMEYDTFFKNTNKVYLDGTYEYVGTRASHGYPCTTSTLPYATMVHSNEVHLDQIQLTFNSKVLPSPIMPRTRVCSMYGGRVALYAKNSSDYDGPFNFLTVAERKTKIFSSGTTMSNAVFKPEFEHIEFELEILRASNDFVRMNVGKFEHTVGTNASLTSEILSADNDALIENGIETKIAIKFDAATGEATLVVKQGDHIAIRERTVSGLTLPSDSPIILGGMSNGTITYVGGGSLLNYTLPPNHVVQEEPFVPLFHSTSPDSNSISNDFIEISYVSSGQDTMLFECRANGFPTPDQAPEQGWTGPDAICDAMRTYVGSASAAAAANKGIASSVSFGNFFLRCCTASSYITTSNSGAASMTLSTIELDRTVQTQYVVATLFPTYVEPDIAAFRDLIEQAYEKADGEDDLWMINLLNDDEYVQLARNDQDLEHLEHIKFIPIAAHDRQIATPPRSDGQYQLILKVKIDESGQVTLTDNTPSRAISKKELHMIANNEIPYPDLTVKRGHPPKAALFNSGRIDVRGTLNIY